MHSTQDQQNTQILSTFSLTTSPVRFVTTIFSPPHRWFHGGGSSQGLHQELCVHIYTQIQALSQYDFNKIYNIHSLSNTMVQWYNISWFHNKVCGFHSWIASNLYKRNIDASSYSCLTKWGPTIHIHSQNLDKKRPSWLSPLTQFSSPQHGCPTLGYSLYHPLISALIFVVHLKKNSSIKTLQQCFQCCTKKNWLN